MFIKKLIVLGAVSALVAVAANATESSSAQFLKLGAGARAAGMGDAFTSVADDVTAAYWNPAGLARLESSQVSFMENKSLVDTQYQYLGGAMPMKNQVLAFSIYRMDYGTIDGYAANGNETQSFDAGSLAASLSMGRKLTENLDAGMSVKYIQESIESEKASSFAGDIGLQLHQGEMNYGVTIQHLGPGLTFVKEKGSLPETIRGGVSRSFLNRNLLVAVDLSKSNDNDVTYHGGAEFKVNPLLTLRGGYQATPSNSLTVDGLKGVTAGLGLNLNSFSFDYGFQPFGELGSMHRISILYRFSSK